MLNLTLDPLVYPPSSTLRNFITGFISTASLEQKQCRLKLLNQEINAEISPDENTLTLSQEEAESSLLHQESGFADLAPISDYVDHIDNLGISDELSDKILAELKSLKLRSGGYKGKPPKLR